MECRKLEVFLNRQFALEQGCFYLEQDILILEQDNYTLKQGAESSIQHTVSFSPAPAH